MSTETITRAPALPKVNLLPPEISERKALKKVQAGVAAVVVLAVAGVGYADVQGSHRVSAAKRDVASAQAQNATLTRQVAKFSDVKTTALELSAREALLTRAMATEVQWSDYLADLSAILPTSTWLTNLTMTETAQAGTVTSPSQVASPVGTVSFQGYALKYPDLASMLDALAKENGLANVYFSTAQEQYIGETKVVNFQATSNVTSDALSGRCATAGSC